MTGFCRWCGQARERCDEACAGAVSEDAARFCPTCGRRLTVFVTLGFFSAQCRDHGEVA